MVCFEKHKDHQSELTNGKDSEQFERQLLMQRPLRDRLSSQIHKQLQRMKFLLFTTESFDDER